MAMKLNLVLAGAIVTVVAALAGVGPAEARCREVGRQGFSVAKSVGADFIHSTDNGRCHFGYVSHGGTRYTSARILKLPANGSLKQDKPFGFQYIAKKGFRGTDKLTLELCGEGMNSKGCAVLNYDVVVQPAS